MDPYRLSFVRVLLTRRLRDSEDYTYIENFKIV
jgi:hypothetical protein